MHSMNKSDRLYGQKSHNFHRFLHVKLGKIHYRFKYTHILIFWTHFIKSASSHFHPQLWRPTDTPSLCQIPNLAAHFRGLKILRSSAHYICCQPGKQIGMGTRVSKQESIHAGQQEERRPRDVFVDFPGEEPWHGFPTFKSECQSNLWRGVENPCLTEPILLVASTMEICASYHSPPSRQRSPSQKRGSLLVMRIFQLRIVMEVWLLV